MKFYFVIALGCALLLTFTYIGVLYVVRKHQRRRLGNIFAALCAGGWLAACVMWIIYEGSRN